MKAKIVMMVESSQIDMIRYDAKEETLTLSWNTGPIYRFRPVQLPVLRSLCDTIGTGASLVRWAAEFKEAAKELDLETEIIPRKNVKPEHDYPLVNPGHKHEDEDQ